MKINDRFETWSKGITPELIRQTGTIVGCAVPATDRFRPYWIVRMDNDKTETEYRILFEGKMARI